MKIHKSKPVIAILSLALYFLMDYCFRTLIPGYYDEFVTFDNGTPGPTWFALSYFIPIALTLLLIFLPGTTFIYAIQCLILAIIIYPSTILLRHLDTDVRILSLQVFYFFSVYFFGNLFKLRVKTPVLKEEQKVYVLTVLTAVLIVPFVIIFLPHINVQNLLLSNIYESRALEATLNNPYTGYLYSPLSNVLLPLLVLFSLYHYQYGKALFAFAMLIFMFLVGGHKAVFFGSFLILVLYYPTYENKIKLILLACTGFLLFALLFEDWFNQLTLMAMSRRIFFLPALLDVAYFDFFDNKPLYWSDSVFRQLVSYPYDVGPPKLIGEYLLGSRDVNANNGIISDGFMNFGVAGAVFNIVCVSIIYGILNTLKISHRFFGVIFLMFFTFYSSYFFLSLLTHGIILLVVVSYFLLKDTQHTYDT